MLTKGDVLFISKTKDIGEYKAGDIYKNYNAIVSKVVREPKFWWQFWKKSKILGYEITFL